MMIQISEETLNDSLKRRMYVGFARHAEAIIGCYEKSNSITFVARDGKDFLGAIVMDVYFGVLHIKYLYVDEKHRGRGIGSKLIEDALKHGQDNNCSFAFVETMNFQACDFYLKLGFELEFTRSGFKHGSSLHYLRKSF